MRKNKLLALIAGLVTVFASTIASSACLYYYQPKVPECLNDK